MNAPPPANPFLGRKLRYGMVGGGPGAFIGAVHRMAAALDGEWELVAGAFSSSPERSREQGRLLGLDPARVYGGFAEMARAEAALDDARRIEAVSVVVPNHLHCRVAAAFLDVGFHVVCDKPMGASLREAEALGRRVEQSGLVFALTHNYTGYPMVKEARRVIRSGRLGAIRKVVAEYQQGWLATPLERTGHKQAAWRLDPALAGPSSAVSDIGSHVHNLVRYVAGLEIDAVFADLATLVPERTLEDDAGVLVRFSGGAQGVFVISQVAAGEENGLRLRVYGEAGGLDWRQERPDELRVMPRDAPRETLERGAAYLSEPARRAARLPAGHPEGFVEAFANVYRNAGRTIGAAIAGVQAGPLDRDFPDHVDGVAGMRFVDAVMRSSAAQEWTPLTPPSRSPPAQ